MAWVLVIFAVLVGLWVAWVALCFLSKLAYALLLMAAHKIKKDFKATEL